MGKNCRLLIVKIGQGKIETRLEDWKPSVEKITDLAEKMGRSENLRQITFMLFSAVLGGLVAWFFKR